MKDKKLLLVNFFFIFLILFFIPTSSHAQQATDDSSPLTTLKCILFADCQSNRTPSTDTGLTPSQAPSDQNLPPTGIQNQPSHPQNPIPTINDIIPNSTKFSCPIINGRILCSSKFTKLSGVTCQHCIFNCGDPTANSCYPKDKNKGDNYYVNLCRADLGVNNGLDIYAIKSQPILFPFIDGKKVKWIPQEPRKYTDNWILKYSTTFNNQSYWLQFHHSMPYSGKSGSSGEEAGKICNFCWGSNTPHTHVQLGVYNVNNGGIGWLDAALKIKCP